MSNRSNDELFLLIKSLNRSEKRLFKLFAQRHTFNTALKIVQLFDAIEKMDDYQEDQLLKKNKNLNKEQLPNLKAHLYKQILNALRQSPDDSELDILFQEQMGNARILYNKALYGQALKILDKLKSTAIRYNHHTYALQALNFEKKIESLHITRSFDTKAQQLTDDFHKIIKPISNSGLWSNLALQLYNWFISFGHSRNEDEQNKIKVFFGTEKQKIPEPTSFYESLYAYQAYCWYAYIQQDFLLYYRYAAKWVWHFEQQAEMIPIEKIQYLKGYHTLLTSLYILGHHQKLSARFTYFKSIFPSQISLSDTNEKVQFHLYAYQSAINLYVTEGRFSDGLIIVHEIELFLKEYNNFIDPYRVLIFYYKIASLYFGHGDYENSIEYLTKIIHWKTNLRSDLQCYARLLHLISHFELGNERLVEYLLKSVYRFMSRMEHLGAAEEAVFAFLRKSFQIDTRQAAEAFNSLLLILKEYEKDSLHRRSFLYLDMVSWLESKLGGRPVQTIIREKFMSTKNGTRNKS
jgi:hypothetical protein